MWLLFYFLIFITTSVVYLYKKKTSRIRKILDDVPGPKCLPIVGNAFEFGTKTDELLKNIHQMANTYGSVFKVWLGVEAFVVLSSAADIEVILSHNRIINKSFVYDFFDTWLGKGLITAAGETWYKKRKLITPAFHFQILEQFIEVFNSNVSTLVTRLQGEVGNSGFDVVNYVNLCTLDIVAESSMGVEINAQKDEGSPFVKGIHEIASSIVYRGFKPWLHPEFVYRLSGTGRNYYRNLKIVQDFIGEVIKNRRQKRLQKQNENEKDLDVEVLGIKKKDALLDLLLDAADAQGNLTDQDIQEEVNTFMFAGHDTTNSGICFTLYCLMKNQHIQENVIQELKEIFENSNRMPTYGDLQSMKYLEKVIKESLRMWPPVPYIGRVATEDILLKSGYTIPKGASVIVFINHLHYNPESFPEPFVFNPDRFDTDKLNGRYFTAYRPFSAGPRNCIGQRFAMLEMKVVLSTIIRNFKVLPPVGLPDINVTAELVLRSTTGVNIRLVNRND